MLCYVMLCYVMYAPSKNNSSADLIRFWSNVNIWNVNCARAVAFIFDTRTNVLVKVSKFLREKISWPWGVGGGGWGAYYAILTCMHHQIILPVLIWYIDMHGPGVIIRSTTTHMTSQWYPTPFIRQYRTKGPPSSARFCGILGVNSSDRGRMRWLHGPPHYGWLVILCSIIAKMSWCLLMAQHDDVIKWKHFPRNWPFVRGIHRSRWIPHTKASDAELWYFLWFASEYTIE